ncbi:hypothetical protein Tco_1319776 [Tanacetum coccineum]
MAESSNVSSSVVQEGVNGHVSQLPNGHVSQFSNGHVSQLPNGHVSQLSNGHVSQLPNGHAAHLPNEHVSQSPRERLVAVLYQEVSADMRKVDQYHRMSRDHWRSVRRLGVSIAELRDLEDWGDGDVTLGLLERLRLDNVEKAVRLCLMMKETEVKIAEKNISIRRLRRNGAVGVNLLLEASLKYVGVCGFLGGEQRRDLEQKEMPNVPNRFLLVFKDRLLIVFNEEVGGDVVVIREYRGIACGLRICMRRRKECIRELKALGDREGVAETVRFMEGLQADDMDRCNHTLALMTEVEVKAREKSRFILKLSGYEVD